jgi:GNAT superfamily N-acetyltransferase
MDVRRFEREGTADARAINRLKASAWREAYDDLLPEAVFDEFKTSPTETQLRQLAAHLRDDWDGIFLAELDGTIRGYCYVRWGGETKPFVGDDEAGLKELYVDPDCWGEGIGTALLDRALETVPEETERLRLEMLAGNEIGRRFYEARGFDRTGTSNVELAGETYSAVIYTLEL